MSEVIVQFTEPVTGPDGMRYVARVCGQALPDDTWHGWIEFLPATVGGKVVRTERETTQPKRSDLSYWASGLSDEYLQGALARALDVPVPRTTPNIPPPQAPPPRSVPTSVSPLPGARAILDPFAVYQQGEGVLWRALGALSADHLRNIIRAYALEESADGHIERAKTEAELAAQIVAAVRDRTHSAGKL